MHQSGVEKASCDESPPLTFCHTVELAIAQDRSIEEEEVFFEAWIDLETEIDRDKDKKELVGEGVVDSEDHGATLLPACQETI